MAGVGGGDIVLDVRGAPVNGATGEKKAGTRQPERPSIYQVPAWIRDLNSSAYTPRFVSFGPYHHGAADLQPMEKHKRTARSRFLRRANNNLDQLKGAVEDLVDDLMDSYEGLDKQWRNDREGFLDLMVLDGCFMLELLIHGYPNNYLAPNATATQGYSEDNPIFGKKGPYMLPHIRRDMLLIENQLPLVLLERLAQSTPGVLPFPHPMISSSSSLKAEVDHGLDPINAAARILSGNYDRSHKQERSEEARFLSIKERYCNVQGMVLRFLASGKLLLESGPLQMALPTPSPAGLLLLVLSFYVRPLIYVLSLVLSPFGRFCLDIQRLLSDVSLCVFGGTHGDQSGKQQQVGVPDLEGIHLLDVYKKSMLLHGDSGGGQVPFSAQQLSHFGVKLRAAETGSFRGIDFDRGKLATEFHFLLPIPVPRRRLRLPVLKVDGDTLPTLLNLVAFERLHHGTGDEVNNYLLLMCSLVRSVEDVNSLYRYGIIIFGPGYDDGAVYAIFRELAEQALPTPVDVVHPLTEPPRIEVAAHCWPTAVGVGAPRKEQLYTEVASYCSTRGARTVRWLRLCRPPPFMAILLSIVAISVSLFIALSNHINRMRR